MWKVIGCLSNDQMGWSWNGACDTKYHGPHPVKQWARVPGEKPHRVKRSSTNGFAKVGGAKEYTEGRAVLYAEWLAQRDGRAIPEGCKISVCWSRAHKRAYAVVWDREYHDRLKGWVCERVLTIDIPHWDWTPQEPVETLDMLEAA